MVVELDAESVGFVARLKLQIISLCCIGSKSVVHECPFRLLQSTGRQLEQPRQARCRIAFNALTD